MFRRWWIIVIGIVLIGLFGYGSVRSYVRNYAIQKEIDALQMKQESLEQDRSQLSALLSEIQSDSFAQAQAREQFGLRLPGEKTIVIQREESALDLSDNQSEKGALSNPERWWRYFFVKTEGERESI